MTPQQVEDGIRQESIGYQRVRDHARRYLIARYGKNVFFRAPETFDNVLERWLRAVSADEMPMAEECMTKIEEMAKAHREAQSE
jgi:hypothetical protein